MNTLSALIDRLGIDVLDHLDREIAIPVHSGLQRQGDAIVVPKSTPKIAKASVPPEGVPAVDGGRGRHAHILLAEGAVTFDRADGSGAQQLIGLLTVPEGAVAWLAHPEHAYTGIGPGTYEIRRQREQGTRRARLVTD